jgi:hypothetical protein
MIHGNFEFISRLQYQVKSLGARVRAFESGEKFVAMRSEFDARLSAKDREVRRLKKELADAHAQIVTVRKGWSEVFDDLEKEHAKTLAEKGREISEWKERAFRAEGQCDKLRDDLREKTQELYGAKTALEDEHGKNAMLRAQINRDHENSSKPSSANPNRKKITNNRESTGRKPGGQPGHEGHGRQWREPTRQIFIAAPAEYVDSPAYRPTGGMIRKQTVGLRVEVDVVEYITPEFVHVPTGQRAHASFPEGMANEVNYGGSVKALAFMLNNYYNVPVDKTSDLIAELTHGGLRLSHGMISGLSREFSQKTEAEQKKAFSDILFSPVINVDFTSARVNGKKMNVLVCSDGKIVLYFARENKGFKGIAGSPIEIYQFILVHDHDLAFYSYGGNHQECLDHVLRYLKDSMQNEPHLKWSALMRELIREMIHFRKHLDPDDGRNPNEIAPGKVAELEGRYDGILRMAKAEYEYEPPNAYYRNGFNLYQRLEKYKDNHLLFMYDRRVPHSNSLAERLLRIYKRKEHQAMTFRSFGSLENLCHALGAIASLREQGKNLYASVSTIFDTPATKKQPEASKAKTEAS